MIKHIRCTNIQIFKIFTYFVKRAVAQKALESKSLFVLSTQHCQAQSQSPSPLLPPQSLGIQVTSNHTPASLMTKGMISRSF